MAVDVRRPSGGPLLIAALLVLATVFFVWGAAAEHSSHTEASHETATTPEGHGSRETAGERTNESSTPSGESHSESEYRPLGINLESTPLIVAGAVISLLLAGLVAWRPSKGSLLAVVLLGAAFALVEVVEVVHQFDVSNTGLTLLALAACATHALVAFLGANEVRVRGSADVIPAV